MDDAKTYAEQATIERIVAETSAHVPVPIVIKLATDAEKTLADGSALWRKPKSAIKDEEYAEFYHLVGGHFDDPALTIHYRAEGRNEYSVLLFVPSMKPFDLFEPDRKGRIKLYVRRVFITDEATILPAWLRFVRGVDRFGGPAAQHLARDAAEEPDARGDRQGGHQPRADRSRQARQRRQGALREDLGGLRAR